MFAPVRLCNILRMKDLTLLPILLVGMQKILEKNLACFSYSEAYFISPLIDEKKVTGLCDIAGVLLSPASKRGS